MNNWKKSKIGSFLCERPGRYDPSDKEVAGLKRLKKIDFSGEIHLADKDSKTDMIIAHPGDLVISGINVAKGAIAVYSGEVPVAATIHYSSYSFDEKQINIEFFKWFIKSPLFEQTLKEQVRGGIKTEIKPKNFLPLEISLPDVKAQAKIVSFFRKIETEMSDLQTEIDSQESLIKQLRQQILQDAIKGKLTADWRKKNPALITGENHASKLLEKIKYERSLLIQEGKIKKGKKQTPVKRGEVLLSIPTGWEYPDLDDITQVITDGTHQTPNYVNDGRIFLSAQNVKPFRFMPEIHRCVSENAYQNYIKSVKPEKGDLLVGRVGSKGEAAVIDIDLDFAFYVSLALVKTFKKSTAPQYLAIAMNSDYGYNYASGNMSSLGASAGNLNLGIIRSFPIPFPPLTEQHVIVNQVSKLMSVIGGLEKQITERKTQSEMLMQSVLREAFEPPIAEKKHPCSKGQ